MSDKPLQLAVLLSGSGRTLQNLIDLISAAKLHAQIKLVIGSRDGLRGIQRANDSGIMSFVVDRRKFENVEQFSATVFSLCDDAQVDLVVLAGWLNLLVIPQKYLGRTINIHPALLPSFGGKGMYGHFVHEAVLAHGCKVSGCTVHFVDNAYDSGPIVLQRTCPVLEDDTPESLADRVFTQELIAFPEAISLFAQNRLRIEGRRVRVLAEPMRGISEPA